MATNYVQEGKAVKLGVSSGAKSGDFEMVGDLAAVLLNDADDNDEAVCSLTGVFDLTVNGRADASDTAVSEGDKLYWDSGDSQINKDATNGVFMGHALDSVTSGGSATIPVRLKQ
jgi:predicted RecA/RadA family phage recombinase